MIGARSYAGEEPTIYPEEERVGEELLQRWIAELLRPLLEAWLNTRGEHLVGADQFIYYEQYNPQKRYAPDVYVLPGVSPATRVRSWKTWQTGIVPSFALEVVSTDWEKDYADAPERCSDADSDGRAIRAAGQSGCTRARARARGSARAARAWRFGRLDAVTVAVASSQSPRRRDRLALDRRFA